MWPRLIINTGEIIKKSRVGQRPNEHGGMYTSVDITNSANLKSVGVELMRDRIEGALSSSHLHMEI